jgi:predicted phosphodiesterase
MANKQNEVLTKTVTKYLETHGHLPSLTLAKLIFMEQPMDFKDVEQVRRSIRYYRGSSGDIMRKNRGKALGTEPLKDPKPTMNFAPWHIPASETIEIEPFTLPKKCNNIGIISDIHVPNHRIEPIRVAMDYFAKAKINTLIINGDLLDNTPFTRHDGKRPSSTDAKRWFDTSEAVLESFRIAFPKASIYWLEGNHDNWYKRWMYAHAHQLQDDPYFDLQSRLHIDEYDITFIPQEQYVMAGKLSIAHGHQFAGKWGVGVSPARTVYNKTKKSVLIGHCHKTDEYTETDLHADITTCWVTGCLCTLTPTYQPMSGKGNHGFAHVAVHEDGGFEVTNKRIRNGKLY